MREYNEKSDTTKGSASKCRTVSQWGTGAKPRPPSGRGYFLCESDALDFPSVVVEEPF